MHLNVDLDSHRMLAQEEKYREENFYRCDCIEWNISRLILKCYDKSKIWDLLKYRESIWTIHELKLIKIYLNFFSHFMRLKFVSNLAQSILTYCLPDLVTYHMYCFLFFYLFIFQIFYLILFVLLKLLSNHLMYNKSDTSILIWWPQLELDRI